MSDQCISARFCYTESLIKHVTAFSRDPSVASSSVHCRSVRDVSSMSFYTPWFRRSDCSVGAHILPVCTEAFSGVVHDSPGMSRPVGQRWSSGLTALLLASSANVPSTHYSLCPIVYCPSQPHNERNVGISLTNSARGCDDM